MPCNILIVDDSQTMRKVIRKAISISGFNLGKCLEAGNGKEALEILSLHHVDIILADLNMPVMNGIEMIQEIRKDENYLHIPVVLITTEGSEKRLEELRRIGVNGYIQKPFYPEMVRNILTQILGDKNE
jgi:two-component system chemotaxis response regulator CheY